MLEKEQNQECRLTHRENRAVRPRSHNAFAAARGSRAGERLQKKAGEVSPDPSYCARDFSRRVTAPTVTAKVQPLSHMPTVIPVRAPVGALVSRTARTFSSRAHRPFGLRRLALTGVAASRLQGITHQST